MDPRSRVGLTGPPGAGKSSLLAALATAYRQRSEEVGVVAADPTAGHLQPLPDHPGLAGRARHRGVWRDEFDVEECGRTGFWGPDDFRSHAMPSGPGTFGPRISFQWSQDRPPTGLLPMGRSHTMREAPFPVRAAGRWMLWIAAVSLAVPRIGQAQELRGSVRDAEGGGPIGDVLVRSDSTGAVTWTDSDGSFALSLVGSGRRTFTFQRFGYETTVVEVEIPLAAPLEVSLEPRPVELEGIEATVTSFEARYAESKARLDRRLARLPGDVSVANASRIRPYDELHQKDPWKFLWSVMRIGPGFEEGRVQVWGIHAVGGRVRTPEVYVDDKRTWLFEFVHTPLSRFCRIEFYTPMPRDWSYGQVPTQLRAYTCTFMAEVASGEREMRKSINFGDLIAGPGEP